MQKECFILGGVGQASRAVRHGVLLDLHRHVAESSEASENWQPASRWISLTCANHMNGKTLFLTHQHVLAYAVNFLKSETPRYEAYPFSVRVFG